MYFCENGSLYLHWLVIIFIIVMFISYFGLCTLRIDEREGFETINS